MPAGVRSVSSPTTAGSGLPAWAPQGGPAEVPDPEPLGTLRLHRGWLQRSRRSRPFPGTGTPRNGSPSAFRESPASAQATSLRAWRLESAGELDTCPSSNGGSGLRAHCRSERITAMTWVGLRCRVRINPPLPELSVDLRTRVNDVEHRATSGTRKVGHSPRVQRACSSPIDELEGIAGRGGRPGRGRPSRREAVDNASAGED